VAAVKALTWESVLAWRLERQHLAARAPREAALDVVADVAGLHAQVASCAELTLWARVDGLEPGAVSELLWERRALVKTWAMRGTLHLLVAAELPRYVAALARLRPRHHVPAWLRAHGLEREQAEAMLAALADALRGAIVTREELAAAVAERVGEPDLAAKLAGGFGDLLKPAAFTGDLCFVPNDGPRVRFARPADWLGGWEPVDGEEAPARSSAPTCAPTARRRASSSSAGSG
jgi:Winged helix DNA-binding domain